MTSNLKHVIVTLLAVANYCTVVDAADKPNVVEVRLSAMPVFDGMSSASGRVYISLENGALECWQ